MRKNQLLVSVIVKLFEKLMRNREYSAQSKTNESTGHMEHAHYSVPELLMSTADEEHHVDEKAQQLEC